MQLLSMGSQLGEARSIVYMYLLQYMYRYIVHLHV